jgi:hypothetical protein
MTKAEFDGYQFHALDLGERDRNDEYTFEYRHHDSHSEATLKPFAT